MKKRGKINIKINLSNRWLYFLITLGILAVMAVGVYALTPGTKPNPGHLLSEVTSPTGCTNGQIIKWNGTNLICSAGCDSSGGCSQLCIGVNCITNLKKIPIYNVTNYYCGGGAITFSNKCRTIQTSKGCWVGNYNIVCCEVYTCTGSTTTLCGSGGTVPTCDNTIIAYAVN